MPKARCRYICVNHSRKFNLDKSIKKLKVKDLGLINLFNCHKINELKPDEDYFKALTRSIVYQQLSGYAAKSIFKRFKALFPADSFPTPEIILNVDIEKLRSSGLSYGKVNYVKNLAYAFMDEPNIYLNLNEMDDGDIIYHLTRVKGIGLWTAQMFLMFTLSRPDVFPATDLAMRKGYQSYFHLNELPQPNVMLKRSEVWIPYRTTVSLYLWSVLEGPFAW